MEREEFKRRLDELGKVILDGVAYFSAWRGLMVADEESARALNRYRGLFLPARHALSRMALMQFAKVFDRRPSTASLTNLLTAAKRDQNNLLPYGTEHNIRQLEDRIASSRSLLERLKRWRDQRGAHHAAMLSGDVSLPHGEVTRLCEEVQSMYNSLTSGHERASTSLDLLAGEAKRHTAEVVRIMREERNRAIQRGKRLRNATAGGTPTS